MPHLENNRPSEYIAELLALVQTIFPGSSFQCQGHQNRLHLLLLGGLDRKLNPEILCGIGSQDAFRFLVDNLLRHVFLNEVRKPPSQYVKDVLQPGERRRGIFPFQLANITFGRSGAVRQLLLCQVFLLGAGV